MKNSFITPRLRAWRTRLALLGMACMAPAFAALTDLATAPLETSAATLVKPNIMYVLDNSGSMQWDFMPDWVEDYRSTNALIRNGRFNGVFYDPAITYTPPLKYDGSSYPSMTSANTSAWRQVPYDGFGVMTPSNLSNTGTNNLFTNSSSGTTQNLTGQATYYVFIAGEYCTAANLRTCVAQTAPTDAYSYPAYLRWCTTSALTNCQAARIDSGNAPTTYNYPRYPGQVVGNGTVPGRAVLTTIDPSGTATYTYPGTSTRSSARTDCTTNTNTCTTAEEMTNFANWWAYYRTRMQAMKSASSIAFNSLTANYRLGFMSINNNTNTTDFLNIADNAATVNGQKSLWYSRLVTALPSGGTPLRFALSQAGRYYANKLTTINGVATTDPIQYSCQRNYTLLSTDGYWNASSASGQLGVTVTGGSIGDQDGSESRPFLDGNRTANTLADVAQYYYITDLRTSDFNNTNNSSGVDVSSNQYANKLQNMVTSTIGLGASGYMLSDPDYANATSGDYSDVAKGTTTSSSTQAAGICSWQSSGRCNWPVPVGDTQTAIDDLWHAAVNGRGSYYSATNSADIRAGIRSFIDTVDAKTSSSAAVAQSAQVLTTGSNYTFTANFCSGKWFGELARYAITNSTGATADTPDWSQSGAGTDCDSASGALTTAALLDNRAYGARNIFTYDTRSASKVDFGWSTLTTTMRSYFDIASIGTLSQLCDAGTSCLPAASQVNSSTAGTTTGAAAVNLVNFLRGDRSNEGSARTRYYRSRAHVLGDIVNSAPVYIQAPARSYTDTGYSKFKTDKATRTGAVYVGANDGMLHAFNADTGAENWAYIPSVLLPNLYLLADKNYAANHQFFVDGQLTQADVYDNGNWRTILVGGLGGGGRAYYALDVTDPLAPQVLWEFSASSAMTPGLFDVDLGYTYGAPVVTKLADGTWVAIVSSGYNNLAPGDGKGHLWVMNAVTGALIKKLDNNMGTAAGGGTVAGCAVAPCPSGLAQISAWTDSRVDNTATQIYGGDLFGNLWRFDISKLLAGSGSATVQLLAALSDASGVRQPITTTPELGLASAKHVVFVGTGSYLGVTDVTTTQVQSMYAMKDPLTVSSTAIYANPRGNACSTATVGNCFVKLTLADSADGVRSVTSSVSYPNNFETMNGWFTDLPQARERVNVDPVLYSGTLVYVSNAPSTSGACSTGGASYLNYVNYLTGLPLPGSDAGGVLTTSGLASGAVLSVNSAGGTQVTTQDSSGVPIVKPIPVATSASGTRRISWRRLTDGP